MTGQRILVCGGRTYNDRVRLEAELDALAPSEICHGGALGADSLAGLYAITRHVKMIRFPADWNKHGKAAGPIRNMQMLREFKPDLVVAFPGGKGTAHMVKIARDAGVPALEVAG